MKDDEALDQTDPGTPSGAPLPPAGWYYDTGMGRQRYWDGRQWTEHIAVGPTASREPVTLTKPPRGTWLRVMLTVAVWIAVYLVAGLVSLLFVSPNAEDPSPASMIVLLVIHAFLAPKVSYRWFDCLFMLIPVYGLVWSFRIIWRVVFLPYRDWTPRPEEALRWTPVVSAPGASRPLYVAQ